MGILASIANFLFGCGLAGLACVTYPHASTVSIDAYTSPAAPYAVTVVTSMNGTTTTNVISAPYGVRTSMVELYAGATPAVEASTTALTKADVRQMQAQMNAMQRQMNRIFADQERLFQNMWNDVPQF